MCFISIFEESVQSLVLLTLQSLLLFLSFPLLLERQLRRLLCLLSARHLGFGPWSEWQPEGESDRERDAGSDHQSGDVTGTGALEQFLRALVSALTAGSLSPC